MTDVDQTSERAFAAAPAARSVRPIDFSPIEGLKRLYRLRHWLMALVWTAAMALVVGSIAYGVHVFTVPESVAEKMTIGPSWKLLVAIAIYCGVILYGSYFLLRGVARVGREFELIGQAEVKAAEWRNSDVATTVTFLERPAPFFYTGSGELKDLEKTAAFELNEILRRNAIERRFDPVGNAVERVAEKVLGGSFGVRDAQQLGVRLGILFTFIGIVLSLSGVDVIMGDKQLGDAAIRSAIRNIVGSLGLAFVSSIAGLLASILLQVLGSGLRVREMVLIEALQKIATTIQGFYIRATANTDRDAIADQIRLHRDDINSLNIDIATKGDRIANAMKDMAGLIEQPFAALRRQSDLLTITIAAQEKALTAVSELAGRVAALQSDVAAAQEKGAEGFARAVTALTERLVSEVHSGFGATAQQDIVRHVEDAGARHDRALRNMTFLYGLGLVVVGVAIGVALVVFVIASGWRATMTGH